MLAALSGQISRPVKLTGLVAAQKEAGGGLAGTYRLPTEAEWEWAAAAEPIDGNFVESERWHPAPASVSTMSIFRRPRSAASWSPSSSQP